MAAPSGSSSASASQSGQPTTLNIELPPQYKPRKPRSQVSVACQLCRKRRSKCSGSYPCVRCAEEKQECIFDGRKSAYQRNQDLRSREKALSKVFDILRSLNGSSSITTIQQLARQTSNIQSFTDSVTELDDSDNIGSSGEGSSARTASKRSPNIKDEGSQYEEDSLMKNLRSSFSESRSRSSNSGNSSRNLSRTREPNTASFRQDMAPEYGSPEFFRAYEHMIALMNDSGPDPGTSFGNLPLSSAIRANGYPAAVQNQQIMNFQFPDHNVLPLHVTEDELLGKIYTSFRDAALQMISSGTPVPEVLGSPDLVKLDLFFRNRQPEDAYNVDNFACEILKTRPDDQSIFVKLACVKMVAYLMRWMLLPTPENYARIPELIRPLPSQRFIPHSPVLDLAPHPAIRDALMRTYNQDWLTIENQTKAAPSIHWPFTLAEAVTTDPATGSLRLTPEFQRHALDPKNWTFKETVLEVFPDLEKLGAQIQTLDISDDP